MNTRFNEQHDYITLAVGDRPNVVRFTWSQSGMKISFTRGANVPAQLFKSMMRLMVPPPNSQTYGQWSKTWLNAARAALSFNDLHDRIVKRAAELGYRPDGH